MIHHSALPVGGRRQPLVLCQEPSRGSGDLPADRMGISSSVVYGAVGARVAPPHTGRGPGAVYLARAGGCVLACDVTVLTTKRLSLRRLSPGDAEFILELLNDSAFLRFIGDKAVRSADDARQYILDGPVASYQRNGFGLWLVELKDSAVPVGMCGLLKRESLPDVDIGFAFLPAYRSLGYAFESASAVLDYARKEFGLKRIVAITDPDNADSIRVLEKIGMRFERMITVSEGAPEIQLHATEG
jgi:[ribosomal protein S5]-alanine N-acetyltransferase